MFYFTLFLSVFLNMVLLPNAYGMDDDLKKTKGNSSKQFLEQEEDKPQKMKFKLGFEFQEISSLCPWALNNNTIQQKTIFFFQNSTSKKRLWKVVIDTSDIEFVTEPFTYQERSQISIAIETLSYSFKLLTDLLKADHKVTFKSWVETIEKEARTLKLPYEFDLFETYFLIKDKFIIEPSLEWTPRFSPQSTIQHPLEYTIPLYFSLFGFDSRYMPQFSASLPLRDSFLDTQKEADLLTFGKYIQAYQQKSNGLVFLHALTLVQMSPEENTTDSLILKDTHTALTQYHQVDAKMKLVLMSRRPFSAMFKDIPTQGSYELYFKEVMKFNTGFYKIPELFCKTNYAEQFFDSNTGAPKPLLSLLPCFRENFLEQNREILITLLKEGVVSTAMLRNFKEDFKVNSDFLLSDIFNNYYEKSLKTVDFPDKTFIINKDNGEIQSIPFNYDTLSPPCFLDTDNSMGKFKEELKQEEKPYGEAIIEVRGISDVQPWFLKKCKLEPSLTGQFLTKPGVDLKKQALCLFDFLTNFGTPEDEMAIFYLGIPYALKKY